MKHYLTLATEAFVAFALIAGAPFLIGAASLFGG